MINTSGIIPVEYKCVVKVDKVEETTKGGIIIAKKVVEREEFAQVKGTLIDIGGNAFEDWAGKKPKPGDRVMIAKYSGVISEGADGEEYRVCQDKDIAAILVSEKVEAQKAA